MKYVLVHGADGLAESPPSRGAWIEIERIKKVFDGKRGRPPRGGRGLK